MNLFKTKCQQQQIWIPSQKIGYNVIIIQSLLGISKNLGANNTTNFLMLFDFSKAFDKIKHSVFLSKILALDISENLFMLIGDYLTGKTQRVKIKVKLSLKILVASVIPQGSVLGLLLFLIYFNDLSDSVFSSTALLLQMV